MIYAQKISPRCCVGPFLLPRKAHEMAAWSNYCCPKKPPRVVNGLIVLLKVLCRPNFVLKVFNWLINAAEHSADGAVLAHFIILDAV
jgi:hypothetical protein